MAATRVHERDALLGGFYTVKEAARLLRINNRRLITAWVEGHSHSDSGPIIDRDYSPVGQSHELSFWDLMEVKFIDHFRKQDVTMPTLRRVAAKAREELGHKHPFALSKVVFGTDRKKIFQTVVDETGDRRTRNVLGDQYEMYDVIEGLFAEGVAFDTATQMAEYWKPLPTECPNVVVDPRYAYGHPVVSDRHVPTAALYRLFRAEGGDTKRVADWFHVSPEAVTEAVEFETRLN